MAGALERCFGFQKGVHRVSTEIFAGITTFITMAYILAVNPEVFSSLDAKGMPTISVFTATALVTILGTLLMAFVSKSPFALGPGMGLNTLFAVTICKVMGHSWQFALTAVFLEGCLVVLVTLTGARDRIIKALPDSLKGAISVGIGLFIAFLGLQKGGIIVGNQDTLVAFFGFKGSEPILAIFGLTVTGIFLVLKLKGAMLLGIVATTILGIFTGATEFHGVVAPPPSVTPLILSRDSAGVLSMDMLLVVFSIFLMDFFNITGVFHGVVAKVNSMEGAPLIFDAKRGFLSVGLTNMIGSGFGSSTATVYIESATGIFQGGRTGLASFTTAICFVIALFLSPIFLAIPPEATTAPLVIIGFYMLSSVKTIDFDDMSEALPAYLMIIIMPMAYSICEGILMGILSYVLINACAGKVRKITPIMWGMAVLFAIRYVVMMFQNMEF